MLFCISNNTQYIYDHEHLSLKLCCVALIQVILCCSHIRMGALLHRILTQMPLVLRDTTAESDCSSEYDPHELPI